MSAKKEEIIHHASFLMSTKGYNDTSLSDILSAANVGKGQFYHYFPSKYELGLAVIDSCFAAFNESLLREVLESDKSPREKLEGMLSWIVAFHQKRRPSRGCFFGNMALEMSEHEEAFRVKLKEVFSAWAGKIEAVLRPMFAGAGAPQDDAPRLALTIVAMLEGGFLLMKNYQDITPLQEMAKAVRLLVAAHMAQGPRP